MAASLTQVSSDHVTRVWSKGLAGLQIVSNAVKHEHTLEKPCPFSDLYHIENEIGSGAYGICLMGVHLASKTKCVVKIVNKVKAGEAYMRNFEERGKDMFNILLQSSAEGNSNVVRYLDFLIGQEFVFIAMEPLEGPELFEYIAGLATVPESLCRELMQQVLAAVSHCHKWGVIHRDIKLENFRFRSAEDVSEGLALVDFGLCCPSQPHEKRDIVGTLLYAAPEVFSGDYSTPVDMWAVGVMFYVLLTGAFPFDSSSYEGTSKSIFDAEHVNAALGRLEKRRVSTQAVNLVKSMLTLLPGSRITAADALNHSWFTTFPSEAKFEPDAKAKPQPPSKREDRIDIESEVTTPASKSFLAARTKSMSSHQFHRNRHLMVRQVSDLERNSPGSTIDRTQGHQCAAVAGTLVSSSSAPCNIVFLDVDGVLAPCVNAGQIVHQCLQAVVTLCKLADAHIVLTSSWRLIEGKVELLNNMLQQHHGAACGVLDVSPDLYHYYSKDLTEEVLPEFDAKNFIRVNDKRGVSVDNALAALEKLGIKDEESKSALREVFTDADFDLNVFSEDRCEYTRSCFSPRSRRAADWVRTTCTPKFAETRCQEIMLWLHLAAKAGIAVKNWVALDDDDLMVRGAADPWERQRSTPFSMEAEPENAKPAALNQNQGYPMGKQKTPPMQKQITPTVVALVDEDDPWAMAF